MCLGGPVLYRRGAPGRVTAPRPLEAILARPRRSQQEIAPGGGNE
jgi:hypothetical protein